MLKSSYFGELVVKPEEERAGYYLGLIAGLQADVQGQLQYLGLLVCREHVSGWGGLGAETSAL